MRAGVGEGYCDERCRVAHVEQGSHGLLCVGPIDSWEHPLAALKLACARDDDGDGHLALIAEMCARCIASAARRGDASSSSSSSSSSVAAALNDANLRTYVAGAVWDWTGASGGDGARARCEAHARMIREAMASHERVARGKLRGAEALMDPASGVVGARAVAELGVLKGNVLRGVESSAPGVGTPRRHPRRHPSTLADVERVPAVRGRRPVPRADVSRRITRRAQRSVCSRRRRPGAGVVAAGTRCARGEGGGRS